MVQDGQDTRHVRPLYERSRGGEGGGDAQAAVTRRRRIGKRRVAPSGSERCHHLMSQRVEKGYVLCGSECVKYYKQVGKYGKYGIR